MNGLPTVGGGAQATARAQRALTPAPSTDPLAFVAAPDVGDHCAAGTDVASLDAFFNSAHGPYGGADYQRATRLADGRVLWTFQDFMYAGTLVHNAAMVQSGRCFTILNDGSRSWQFAADTASFGHWFWPLAGATSADGSVVRVFFAEMVERSARYLGKTEPVATWLVTLRSDTLEPVAVELAPDPSAELYGWSVTSDRSHTYLYGHCYRQFGWSAFGHDPCAENVRVARVPLGELSTVPEYWNGVAWNSDRSTAAPVIGAATTGAGVNPAQVMWDGTAFLAIVKEGDWWGTDIVVASSAAPTGPFEVRTRITQPLRCEPAICNTYFASWLPWRESPTTLPWGLSNNRWDGAFSDVYRPTFHAVPAPE